MEHRSLGRLGQMDSVLIYGGAALGKATQEEADHSISEALESGINHFDTAASYGDGQSELRLAPWMPRIRDNVFLSTKTKERTRESAKRGIQGSLERLGVDSVDLLQLHSVGDLETLDLLTAGGGALEAAIEAMEEGLTGAVGITGHGHRAPATHLEALRRYPFDTVMTPLNFVLGADEAYYEAYGALVAEVMRQGAGLMAIKAISRGPWGDQDRRYNTWYEPFDREERIDAAVAFVLSHGEITGLTTAGDVRLLPMIVRAAEKASSVTREEIEASLSQDEGYSSPFVSPF